MNISSSPIYFVWKKVCEIPQYNLSISGYSRAGERSGFAIPELKLMFDAGLPSNHDPSFIFITHCHSDHCFALPTQLAGLQHSPKIYVPFEELALFTNFVNASAQLAMFNSQIETCNIFGVKKHDTIKLKNNYKIEVFDLEHMVPCRGFGLKKTKEKLKEIYTGYSSAQIIALKKTGADVTTTIEDAIVAYITDTNESVFEKNRNLLNYKYIVIECTYINNDDVLNAAKHKHIHWKNLKPIVLANQQITFVLIHFSWKHTAVEIRDFFARQQVQNIIICV